MLDATKTIEWQEFHVMVVTTIISMKQPLTAQVIGLMVFLLHRNVSHFTKSPKFASLLTAFVNQYGREVRLSLSISLSLYLSLSLLNSFALFALLCFADVI